MGKVKPASNGPPRRSLLRGLSVLSLVIVLVLLTVAVAAATGTIDFGGRTDFMPGEQVPVTLHGFAAGDYHIPVIRPDGTVFHAVNNVLVEGFDDFTVVTDPDVYEYQLNGIMGQYEVRVYPASWNTTHISDVNDPVYDVAPIATAYFTDSSVKWFNQCANGTTGSAACDWINGDLNRNNSRYDEGDATVQRLWLQDLSCSTTENTNHTVTIQYGTTRHTGLHAYDYLTDYNFSEKQVTQGNETILGSLCYGIPGCIDWDLAKIPMERDATAGYLKEVPDSATRYFSIFNAVAGSATPPQLTEGTLTGNSETEVTLTFVIPPANCPASKKADVLVAFGAHVAEQSYWGTGKGASSIGGSPYHVAIVALDGTSIGKRDNQMQSSAVTAVTLAGFSGRATGGQARLEWRTGTEADNAGFNVLRATSAAGPFVKVNPQLIGATGDAVAGAAYSFVDKPGYGVFFYKLEDVNLSGKATAHGPVQVTVVFPFRRLPQQPAPPAQ